MLSLDLFDSKYEKKLHEGALDDTIIRTQAHLMEPLSQRAADIRTQIRNGKLSGAELDKLEKEYEDLVQQRQDIIFNRKTQTQEQQVPSKQDPFAYVKPEPKGIGDIQDPKAKMAQLAQRSKKGPLANVGAGLKAFIKGEPEPMGEGQEVNPRALGVANFQRLVKANMGNIPTVSLEFIRPEENFKLDQRGLDLISDYYDGLADDQAKNYFIYRVLPSGDETKKILKQIGWNPEQVQPSLPGIPTQGELPLSEKKKSKTDDDLQAGDIKVARELQKLRAQYPAARSDVEAVARAEIDSTERNQRQLAAIRGANEKQDALLKQLVALDQEQGREINSLDSELDRVQSVNDKLQQTLQSMTGAKKASVSKNDKPSRSIDLIPGAPADTKATVAPEPEPAPEPVAKTSTSPAIGSIVRTVTAPKAPSTAKDTEKVDKDQEEPLEKSVTSLKALRSRPAANVNDFKLVGEHGGGIGPKQHWQDLMQEGQPQELINRYLAIDAETDVEAVRAAIQAISRDPGLGANSKSRLLGQIGMIIRRHRLPIGRSYYTYMQQYMEEQDIAETVTDVKPLWAQAYHKLAPKIERHRDSFLAGQLYDELENIAELHGAEGEFKRMMSTARGRAHMEYDTNPGGFHNWFWFLPFEDNMEEGIKSQLAGAALAGALALGAGSASARVTGDEDPGVNRLTGKPNVTQAVQGDQVKPSAPTGFSKEYLQSVVDGTHPRPMITKEKAQALLNQLKEQGVAEGTDDIKKRMSKLEALALAANRAGDDAKCKMYQQKIQSLKQKLSQSMAEGWSDKFVAQRTGRPRTPYSVYIKGKKWKDFANDDHARAVMDKLKAKFQADGRDPETITIAPTDMSEDIVEGIRDTASATAVIACLLTGGSLSGCATAPQQTSAQQVLKTGQDIGRTVQTAKKITRAGTEAEVQQELRNILRGINRPEELNNSNIIRIWKRIQGQPPVQQEPRTPEYGPADPVKRAQFEAREIVSKEDFVRERDRLLRMIGQETNPANKQILKSAIRQLENRAENEGWITIQNRMVREDSDNGEAVEMAIMRRMLVAHTDLIVEFGLDKVVQAIEEVAYDVGDVDEIGSSDVSGWVRQVRQILGATA
jgi:hypothetical protein